MTKQTMPPFGDILNAGIQTIKQLCNRNNGITPKAFDKVFDELTGVTDSQKTLRFINPEMVMYGDEDDEFAYDECYEYLTSFVIECLCAMGAIKDETYNLQANLGQTFASFITFDDIVTPDNLIQIDPFGKIYFWMAGTNFFSYQSLSVPENSYQADLGRFDSKSFRTLKEVNRVAYGDKGDPLINHLIEETMRRTSVFMNNYADVLATNDHVKVTPQMILDEISYLTPTQFEYLCLQVVQMSLEKENSASDMPNCTLTPKHTGKSNDGGLDGIITQTFDNGEEHTYYIQAKQYADGNNVGNGDLRNFVGGYPPNTKHHHGIFITTSDFTKPAKDYAESLGSHNLILINKMMLIDLMIEHEIGLEKVQTETLIMNKSFFKKIRKK